MAASRPSVPVSNAQPWPENEVEPVWYRIDLHHVAALVDEYASRLWKDKPWYHDVHWRRVADTLGEVLQHHCREGVLDAEPEQLLTPIERTLSQTDREGLYSLIWWPVDISRQELHNGGHRAAAMRAQGVRFVPGQCLRGDVGSGIDLDQLYPIQEVSRGGRFSSEKPQ